MKGKLPYIPWVIPVNHHFQKYDYDKFESGNCPRQTGNRLTVVGFVNVGQDMGVDTPELNETCASQAFICDQKVVSSCDNRSSDQNGLKRRRGNKEGKQEIALGLFPV